jgi:hypothetical protein
MIEMTNTSPYVVDPQLKRRVCDGQYVIDAHGVAEAMLSRGILSTSTSTSTSASASASASESKPAGSGVLVTGQLHGISARTAEDDARTGVDSA